MHVLSVTFLLFFQYGFKDFVNGVIYQHGIKGGVEEMQLRLCTNAFYMMQKSVGLSQLEDIEMYLEFGMLSLLLIFNCSFIYFRQLVGINY